LVCVARTGRSSRKAGGIAVSASPLASSELDVTESPVIPPTPEKVADIGLSADAVRDLLLKVLYVQGSRTGQHLADFVRLPFPLVDEELLTLQQRRFIEVRGTIAPHRGSYLFDLAGEGRDRAREALEASQYVGPMPVPLAQYQHWIHAQSIKLAHVTQESLHAGFSHLVLEDSIFEILGPAVNSSKSIFLYGHPGNGKTAIAEAISEMLGGVLYLPYAVDIDGQIMQVFDPVHHEEVTSEEVAGIESLWRKGPSYDRRYARVQRPVVLTGGELTLDQLDLRYDPFTKLYQAPFQVKANGGVLIVDDFGRQRVPPRDLLNRWIVPLEKRIDYLTLHTGGKFPVPFDCLLIFATNLDPAELVEEAFLRRNHYKVPVSNPTRAQYEEIFRAQCVAEGLTYEPNAVAYVFSEFYDKLGIPPRGCHPRDLIAHVEDIAKYREVKPQLTPELIEGACRSYFLLSGAA
jgi:predicted ATPase with chaperone activity